MRRPRIWALLIVGVIALTSVEGAQESLTFEPGVTHRAQLPYLLYTPRSYARDAAKEWPLIVYLHAGSLRGSDTAKVRTMDLPHRLETDADFPFLVVSPLCPEGEIWTDAPAVAALIDEIVREHKVDANRIYLTGHSMGGRGALYFAF